MRSLRELCTASHVPYRTARHWCEDGKLELKNAKVDEVEFRDVAGAWAKSIEGRVATGGKPRETEKDYKLTLMWLKNTATGEGGSAVDAQGLTDQDKLERMDRAVITETAKENAESLTKINKSLLDGALAREKARREFEAVGRLADVTRAVNACEGYFRHIARGLETFTAQHADRLAKETGLPKADIRKLLDAAEPHLLEIHKDGLALLRARVDEHRAKADAEAAKRTRR